MPHAHPQTSTYVPPLRTASSAPPRRHEARLGDVRRGLERSNSGRYSPYRRQQPRSYSHEDSPAPVNPPIARRFAPAYRFGETENLPTERPDGNGPSSQSRNYLPPLRRNRHRVSDGQDDQPVPTLAEAQLDGLGDRRRSISPMENNWEMLFSTIPPDDRLPSAESSFTSASASARSLSSNGRASASTNPTVASLGDLIESSHVCPEPTDSSSSDTDEEDYPVGEFMDSQRVTVHHMHSHHHHHHHVDGPAENRSTSSGRQTPEDPEPISFPPGRTRPLPREDRQRRSDLQQMHDLRDILACLERQEPVPEEWWASAGLARNLGGSISRVQDRVERERL